MTIVEAAKILAVLKAAYPNSYKGMSDEAALGTCSVWAIQFADMPVDVVLMAVHKAIATNTFPPSISEVKQKLYLLHWEAYEMLDGADWKPPLPEHTKEMARRIYEETGKYNYSERVEPKLSEMLPGIENTPLLGISDK